VDTHLALAVQAVAVMEQTQHHLHQMAHLVQVAVLVAVRVETALAATAAQES
jgi:hypothetical protein